MQARSKPQLFRLSALTLALLTSGAMAQTTPELSPIKAKIQMVSQNVRADYDLDNDGLIEINILADLNEIRNNLDGKTLYGSSAGCPATGCNGFELTRDLDFDTNSDGQLNEEDAYWRAGKGWLPIGTSEQPFHAVFEGNNRVIRNLMSNNSHEPVLGLFGFAQSASLNNLGLTGPLVSIVGGFYAGALIGHLQNGAITGCYAAGNIQADNAGALVGGLVDSTISRSFASGTVLAKGLAGRLVAASYRSSWAEVSATTKVMQTGGYKTSAALVAEVQQSSLVGDIENLNQ